MSKMIAAVSLPFVLAVLAFSAPTAVCAQAALPPSASVEANKMDTGSRIDRAFGGLMQWAGRTQGVVDQVQTRARSATGLFSTIRSLAQNLDTAHAAVAPAGAGSSEAPAIAPAVAVSAPR